MKQCTRCGVLKARDEFGVQRNKSRDGRRSSCKMCVNAADRSAYTAAKARARYIKRTYGLTVEQFDRLYEAQEGRCAICESELHIGGWQTHVDHCHSTGKLRGLLCRACNVSIGQMCEEPARLVAAAGYLIAHSKEQA